MSRVIESNVLPGFAHHYRESTRLLTVFSARSDESTATPVWYVSCPFRGDPQHRRPGLAACQQRACCVRLRLTRHPVTFTERDWSDLQRSRSPDACRSPVCD